MSTLGERLKMARERKGYSQTEVYRRTNINNKTLSRYEKDGSEPDNETLITLANLYEVSLEYLLTGNSKMPKITLPPKEVYDFIANQINEYRDNHVFLPVLGTIRAGVPILMDKQYDEYQAVEKGLLRGRDAFVLRVSGNSMSGDRIYDGDKVVVVVQNHVDPNDIAVVAVNGEEATLKRVKYQNGIVILIPSNPEMQPQVYGSTDIHILGKVVESRRVHE